MDRSDDAALRWLIDRAAIEDLIVRLNFALDDRDFDAMAAAFVPDSTITVGGQPVAGSVGFAAAAAAAVADIDGLQHAPMAILVEPIDADTAAIRTQAIVVQYVREGPVRLAHGVRFRYRAVRTAEGWRLASFDPEIVWTDGDPAGRAAAIPSRRPQTDGEDLVSRAR